MNAEGPPEQRNGRRNEGNRSAATGIARERDAGSADMDIYHPRDEELLREMRRVRRTKKRKRLLSSLHTLLSRDLRNFPLIMQQ